MTTAYLTEIIDALRNGADPRTGEIAPPEHNCLHAAPVRQLLDQLYDQLTGSPESGVTNPAAPTATAIVTSPLDAVYPPTAPPASDATLPDHLIRETCTELRSLGYTPTVMQLIKVFIGSRSIVDRHLKALTGYKRYRGVITRTALKQQLVEFSRRQPEMLPIPSGSSPKTKVAADKPWKGVDFFRTEAFDKLEDTKEKELRRAVTNLGLRKANDRLPAYMVAARQKYPRSYEPWTRDEQALLIEAMCYTNQLARLAVVFGRSASSIESAGQRLIWDSMQKRA